MLKLEKLGPILLGCLVLLLVLWALPAPARNPSSSDESLSGPEGRPAESSASGTHSSMTGGFARSGPGFARPSRIRSDSGRRQVSERSGSPGVRSRSEERTASSNLARLESGDWEERQTGTAEAGPQGPRQPPNPRDRFDPGQRLPGDQPRNAGSAALMGELEELERGYQSAQNLLFPGYGGGVGQSGNLNQNPFDQALPDDSSDVPTDPVPTTEGDSSDGENGEGGGGDETPAPDGGDSGDPDAPDNTAPEGIFDFVVVGAHGSQGELVSRASFTGAEFVLEDNSSVSFFPGGLHSLLSFGADSILAIEDTNGDGRLDFVRAREVPSLGTSLELFEQASSGTFELAASTILYLERIHSLVLFDIDGDSELELLVARDGEKRIVVFERSGRDWNYREEYALPIKPGLMLVSSEPGSGGNFGKLLYIIDSELKLVLNARATSSVVFYFGQSTLLQRLRSVNVDFQHQGGAPDRVRIIEMADRLLLFDDRGGEFLAFANIALGKSPPFLIIGDYSGTGRREMIWLP